MQNVKTAIIGTGFMGPVHLEGLRRLGIDVTGILGSTKTKSRAAADKLGLAKAYRDYAEVLADREVGVVHITTPNQYHFEMAKSALLAGKHVLCEKPLAMTSEESSELVAVAKQTGLAAGVNYNIRFYPLNLEARERVHRGDVGDIFSVTGSYVQDWLLYPTDYNWRVLAEKGGRLRAVADIGTHWLDLTRSITGLEVEAIFAELKTVHPIRQRPKGEVETFSGKLGQVSEIEPVNIDTEDSGCVLIRYKGGARGCLWVSQAVAGRKNCLRYEIAGAKSALAWNSEAPNSLWLGHRDRANEDLIRDPSLLSDTARAYANYPGGHNEGFPDTFKQCFRAFYDYIAAGDFSATPFFPTFADGHQEILLCEAILQSHEEERWVKL